ncbi:MAG: 4-hydroxy-3-methylbut-2-enyl diphosphate reductase [Culicoidibacterales bacterium]
MKVIKITPRGYCHGVVKALNIVTKAIADKSLPQPIYILGQIVHNQHITDAFAQKGAITLENKGKSRLELLEPITSGTIILTAHGVSPQVIALAKSKNLHIINAVCPDVDKTHELIKTSIVAGYKIIYIGKKGHPEPEGALGIDPVNVLFVETIADVHSLPLDSKEEKILITNQTTLSIWDVAKVAQAIEKRYPFSGFFKEICDATQIRQEAVVAFANLCDLILVIGDPKSNNTNKLVQIAVESSVRSYRIEDIRDLNPFWLKDVQCVGVTSGASTPTKITNNAIAFLEQFEYTDTDTWTSKDFFQPERIVPQLDKIKG